MNSLIIRMFFYLLLAIISIFLPSRRERIVYSGSDAYERRIRAFFRRRGALRKCNKFVSRKNKSIILRNGHVIVACDTENKTIVCLNALDLKMSTSVEWESQARFLQEDMYDNSFELAFDTVCLSFNEKTTYHSMVQYLRRIFDNVKENIQQSNERVRNEIINTQNAVDSGFEKININEATENALSNLPGINIATAKKIVQRVNTKGDFLNVEQMCQEMKIKEHFRVKLYDYVYAQPTKRHKKTIKDNDDRIIDL